MRLDTKNKKTKILFVESAQGFGGSIVSLSESLKGMPDIESFVLVTQEHEALGKLYSPYHLIYKKTFFNYYSKQRYSDFLKRRFNNHFISKLFIIPFLLFEKLESTLFVLFIVNLVKKEGIQLIYSNNGYNPAAVAAAKKCKLPCTLHFRGYKTTAYPFSLKDYSYPQKFFAISHFVADYLKNSGVPEDRVVTIHNSVDMARYDSAYSNRANFRQSLALDNDVIAIGVFGRITEWKGQEEFIKAINILEAKTAVKFKAFVVGDCSDEDSAYFDNLVKSSELLVKSNKLEFCGYQRDVEQYYTAMDIVVHTSNIAEPFGRVIIEGMAAGAAVIGMNEGGPAEVITAGIDGILIEPRSLNSMVNALVSLCDNDELRHSLGVNAKLNVRKNYTPERIGGKIEQELLKMIGAFDK